MADYQGTLDSRFASRSSYSSSINQCYDSTTTPLRYQSFDNCLEDEPQFGTLIPCIKALSYKHRKYDLKVRPLLHSPFDYIEFLT